MSGEGVDTVETSISYTLGDNLENLTLTQGDIDGTGNELDNTIIGSRGNNTIDGGLGADTMAGGDGNDTYIIDNMADSVTEANGGGSDTIISPFDYVLGSNVENITLTGLASTGTGNTLDNTIIGTVADNTLTGLAGDDTLDGGEGADAMVGGVGDDTYVVDNTGDVVAELAGEGVDSVKSSITWSLGDNLEDLTLTGSSAIDGTGNELDNIIVGNSAGNTLAGHEGNDLLDGGAGADAMSGGTGNDTYIVDNIGDVVSENSGEGTDQVESSITYTLNDNLENLTLTGTENIDGAGNELDNVITGNRGGNTLTAHEGDDTLDGGQGADTLIGGVGNDKYIVDRSDDVVIENVDKGHDEVQASASYTLSANLENLTLTGSSSINGSGNELDNSITGNSGSNTLDGGAGADTMAAGLGNDTYMVDSSADSVIELDAQGNDTVQTGLTYALGDHVENLTLTGADNIDGTGNTLNNALTGNEGDNNLYGDAGNDDLMGGDGNDHLDGGADADFMAGDAGDDSYIVDHEDDLVFEFDDEGHDSVETSISYTLTDNVEDLTLTGSDDIDGTGNGLENHIAGNTGANQIDGGTGADTMAGGADDDTYSIDNVNDQVIEQAGEGIDTVKSSVSTTLDEQVENLILTGEADLDGSGNDLDNQIIGTSGDNLLDGGTGIDTMMGGTGDDTYIVDETGDTVIEGGDEGEDSVFASSDYTLSENLENLTLTGDENLSGEGNASNNTITGNSDINTLIGNGGDDTYVVQNTADVVVENATEGDDSVFSSVTYTLSDHVENLSLTGVDDIDGTGSAQNNTITGNSGANTIDGGAGVDAMAGGAGDDTYIIDNSGDSVSEGSNAGADLVYASVSHTLSSKR